MGKAFTLINNKPTKAVSAATEHFPKNKIKSPTLLIVAIRKAFETIVSKAVWAAEQKFLPSIAENK